MVDGAETARRWQRDTAKQEEEVLVNATLAQEFEVVVRRKPNREPIKLLRVVEGAAVRLVCSADGESVQSETLTLEREDGPDLVATRTDNGDLFVHFPSFSHELHAGTYECSAEEKLPLSAGLSGRMMMPAVAAAPTPGRPSVRVKLERLPSTTGPASCLGITDYCQNGGKCLPMDGHPACRCAPDYHGPRCESVLIHGGVVQAIKTSAGVGGTLALFLIVLVALLGVLYWRERTKRHRFQAQLNQPLTCVGDDDAFVYKPNQWRPAVLIADDEERVRRGRELFAQQHRVPLAVSTDTGNQHRMLLLGDQHPPTQALSKSSPQILGDGGRSGTVHDFQTYVKR